MKKLLLAAGLLIAGTAHADQRDLWMFAQWAGDHQTRPFREMLVDARLYGVVPIHQLLRSASDWKLCHASPFAVPPVSNWPAVRSTLSLIKVLDGQGILRQFEVVSAYRDPRLNMCAGGADNSAHTRAFAVDILLPAWADPNCCAVSGSSMARCGAWAWGATRRGASIWIPRAIAPGAAMAARGRRFASNPSEPGSAGTHPLPTLRSAGACRCRPGAVG